MAESQDAAVYTHWSRPRSVGGVLEEGRPRPQAGSASGFDLSWQALDAWATAQASGDPCMIVLTGFGRRPDGFYWYDETINPEYVREVLGWSDRGGRLVPVCPECDQYPRHARGCSLAP